MKKEKTPEEKLEKVSAEFRNYKSWHDEFYERIEAKNSELVNEVEEGMANDMYDETGELKK